MAAAINPRNTLRKFRQAWGGRELIGEHRFDMPPLKARERHIAVRFAKVLEDAAPLALCLGRKTCKG
jgi:hypothetical protein